MLSSRLFVFVVGFLIFSSGCSSQAELAKARAEADAACAEAAKARAEAEAAKAALPKPAKTPTGLRVWRDTEAEEFCKWLGIEADCYKYEGGELYCWIEIDVDGKKTHFGEYEGMHRVDVTENVLNETVVGIPSGAFAWLRHPEADEEDWELAFKCRVETSAEFFDRTKRRDSAAETIKEDSSGEASSSSRIRIDLPQPSAPGTHRWERGDSEFVLEAGEEVTLATLLNFGENEDQITRTAKLKCKVLKRVDENVRSTDSQ